MPLPHSPAASATPRVSVIIACRNAAATLGDTLQSVLSQSYRQLEVIVVDDGSTDGSGALAQQTGDARVRLLPQTAKGAQVARNIGIAASSGELLQFLDADDLLHPEKIANQVQRYRQLGANFLYFGGFSAFSAQPSYDGQQPTAIWADLDPVTWVSGSWAGAGMMPPHAWLVPRPLLKAAGLWDERLLQNQDGEFFTRLLLYSQGARFCPQALCYYRVGQPGSVSANNSLPARESLWLSVQLSTDALLARENSERTRKACAVLLMDVAARTAPYYPRIAWQAFERARGLGVRLRTNERGALTHWLAEAIGWGLVLRLQPLFRWLRDAGLRPVFARNH